MTTGWLSKDLDMKIAAQLKMYNKADKPISAPHFITISRELGCNGKNLAEALARKLTNGGKDADKPWEVFGKDSLREFMDELHLKPDTLKQLSEYGHSNFSGFIQDTLLGRPSQFETIKKVGKLQRLMALSGNVILLGSGASVLTNDLEGGIHVRLFGDLEWRISNYAHKHGIDGNQARREVTDKANQREAFAKNYLAHDISDPSLYHAMFNNAKISVEMMAEWVVELVTKGN